MSSLTKTGAVRSLANAATPARRKLFALTIALMLLGALAELATIGAVIPFLALVTAPARAEGFPLLAGFAALFGGGQRGLILAGAAVLTFVAICAGIIRLTLTWSNLKFTQLYGHDVGRQIYGRLLRQPYGDFVTRNSSVALSAFDKLNGVIAGILLPVMLGTSAAVISVFIAITLVLIDPVAATIAGVSIIATYALVIAFTRAKLMRNSIILSAALTGRTRIVQEGLGGLRDILIDNSQPVYEQAFADLDRRYRTASATNTMVGLAPRFVVETAVVVMIAIVTVYFAQKPGGLIAAVPVLGALAIGAQRLLPLIHQAYNGWTAYAGNSQLLLDVAELLQISVLKTPDGGAPVDRLPFEKNIVVDHVSFGYPGREAALCDLSLTIAKGERVGFVGRTGSGKSTLIDLLMGLLNPSEGQILVDGVTLDAQNVAGWQAQIAHVPQAIYLSDGSVASNIALGVARDNMDFDRIREAARRADIDEFIMSHPQGYEATVGERGVRLSGGQRQRIGIARSLYKGANVLVFDEATSALDESTEEAIMNSIYGLDKSVTLLMIAHRLSTLSGCDRIIRLNQGRISA